MMNKCIKCGSYVFNLYKEDIEQGGLCDVHYWQGRAHRAEALAEQPAQHQEPVGTVQCINGVTIGYLDVMQPVGTKLYTAPQPAQPRKPLPFNKEDMEGLDVNQRLGFKLGWKSAEAAHNIKENT